MRKKDEAFFELLFIGKRDSWWNPESPQAEMETFDLASRVDELIQTIAEASPWPSTTTEVELVASEEFMVALETAPANPGGHLLLAGHTEIVPPRTKHLHMVRYHLQGLSTFETRTRAERAAAPLAAEGVATWTIAPRPKPEQLSQQLGETHFQATSVSDVGEAFAHYDIYEANGYNEGWMISRPDASRIQIELIDDSYCVTFHGIRELALDRFPRIAAEDLYFVVDNLVAGKRALVRERFASWIDLEPSYLQMV